MSAPLASCSLSLPFRTLYLAPCLCDFTRDSVMATSPYALQIKTSLYPRPPVKHGFVELGALTLRVQLTIDTGRLALLIQKGLYHPITTSQPTNLSEFNQFNGASQDGVAPASGTYDCSPTAPWVGFSFSSNAEVHYIDSQGNVLNRTADGRVGTTNILGTSTVDTPLWSIGQTWFQGRYVQHNLDNNTLFFVDLA
ncbi:hypothetical protein BD414DRAFT_578226 [Trametes punicea]|nr:hypothetical protein BD414DRAFT_578226 [Trametes punicea]